MGSLRVDGVSGAQRRRRELLVRLADLVADTWKSVQRWRFGVGVSEHIVTLMADLTVRIEKLELRDDDTSSL